MTDPLTWTTSGDYARGCSATGACAYATDCVENSITYDDGVTSSCQNHMQHRPLAISSAQKPGPLTRIFKFLVHISDLAHNNFAYCNGDGPIH
ncbi:hypothetical protein N7478_004409 [Penicillium angulare]|uniref:uncharacterized protein n=1 Tax=Penicillium angulare TaxID=116970 RepID=UPI002541A2B0|nr:uncharacterized protein N7478_004409 [Penicillium angulare]KAJ5279037.1 hypothetical protein N7478_004409 [Penicillium angulare]